MKPSSSRQRFVIFGSGLLLIVALYFGWQWAGQDTAKPAASVKKEPAATKQEPIASPEAPSTTKPAPPMAAAANQLTTVEEGDLKIDEILRSEKEIPQMARDLHELVKTLNSEAQVNASRHLVNLTGDEDYGLIAGFLVDDKMNPEVTEVLFSDLMNRNRELQMPLFMNILKNKRHPQNEEVRNVLTVLAGEDFGEDYAAWDKWAAEELAKEKAEQ